MCKRNDIYKYSTVTIFLNDVHIYTDLFILEVQLINLIFNNTHSFLYLHNYLVTAFFSSITICFNLSTSFLKSVCS